MLVPPREGRYLPPPPGIRGESANRTRLESAIRGFEALGTNCRPADDLFVSESLDLTAASNGAGSSVYPSRCAIFWPLLSAQSINSASALARTGLAAWTGRYNQVKLARGYGLETARIGERDREAV